MALILTLLFVVLLTVLVVEFAYEAQVEASYSMNSGNDYQARLAARSAVYKGISILEMDRLQAQLSTTMTPTNNNNNNNMNTANQGSGITVDSRWSSWAQPGGFEPLNDAVMRTTITDEYGKLNLNALVDNQNGKVVREHLRYALQEFFRIRGEAASAEVDPESLVEAIIDWIDDDDEQEEGGAESDFYLASENPYNAKNGPMDSLDELLLIKGMTPALFFGAKGIDPPQLPLTEFLTVHGDWLGRINPNTVYIDYDSGISDVLEAYAFGWQEAEPDLIQEVKYEDMIQDMVAVEDVSGTFQSVDDIRSRNYIVFGNIPSVDDGGRGGRGGGVQVSQSQTQQNRAQEEMVRYMFTVYSHVFRIQGDAMLDDLLVRNEAYVLRTPEDAGLLEFPSGNSQMQTTNPFPPLPVVTLPAELYRILEWKVIQ
ncbi:MAG: general secretion pathway protein GspK [Candidatus Hydrogenedentes bacterium]|nr:general secretion pathway protein GspK [Candidatus Hydrogenedentota bacterium]